MERSYLLDANGTLEKSLYETHEIIEHQVQKSQNDTINDKFEKERRIKQLELEVEDLRRRNQFQRDSSEKQLVIFNFSFDDRNF